METVLTSCSSTHHQQHSRLITNLLSSLTNMKASTLFSAFAALASLVAAAPAPGVSPVANAARGLEPSPPPLSYEKVTPITDVDEVAAVKREMYVDQDFAYRCS